MSDLVLDAVVAGERTPPEHIEGCPRCRGRLALFRELKSVTPIVPAPKVSPRRARWPWLGGLAVAAAAIGVMVISGGDGPVDHAATIRTKGSAVSFFVKRNNAVFRGESGDVFYPGDALRFRFSLPRRSEIIVVGIEENKPINVYVPFGGERSVPLPAGEQVDIEGSLVLDETGRTSLDCVAKGFEMSVITLSLVTLIASADSDRIAVLVGSNVGLSCLAFRPTWPRAAFLPALATRTMRVRFSTARLESPCSVDPAFTSAPNSHSTSSPLTDS